MDAEAAKLIGAGLAAIGMGIASLGVGNVFHFPKTATNVYPNNSHTFPAAIAFAVRGLTLDAVAFVLDANGRPIGVSNVSRVNVQ